MVSGQAPLYSQGSPSCPSSEVAAGLVLIPPYSRSSVLKSHHHFLRKPWLTLNEHTEQSTFLSPSFPFLLGVCGSMLLPSDSIHPWLRLSGCSVFLVLLPMDSGTQDLFQQNFNLLSQSCLLFRYHSSTMLDCFKHDSDFSALVYLPNPS